MLRAVLIDAVKVECVTVRRSVSLAEEFEWITGVIESLLPFLPSPFTFPSNLAGTCSEHKINMIAEIRRTRATPVSVSPKKNTFCCNDSARRANSLPINARKGAAVVHEPGRN